MENTELQTDNLYPKLCSASFIIRAWEIVKQKGSQGGIDKVSIEAFENNFDDNIHHLINSLVEETYVPEPYQEIKIPKGKSSFRTLGLPSIKDKILQQAVRLLIEPILNPIFLGISYAYRPGKGPLKAVNRVNHFIVHERFRWAILCDIDRFFDNIDQKILMEQLKEYIKDSKILRLISLWITMGKVDESFKWKDSSKGISQGSVISPLLSNLYLHPLDKFMVKRLGGYVRYGDNFIFLCSGKTEAERCLKNIEHFLMTLKLKLNPEREIRHVSEGFVFLGVFFKDGRLNVTEVKLSEIKEKVQKSLFKDDQLSAFRETLEGIKRYYGQFLPEERLKLIDEASVSILKKYLQKHYKAGTYKTKKEIETILYPVPFLSHEYALYRGRIIREILAFCKREKNEKITDKQQPSNPVLKKKRQYERLQASGSVLVVNRPGMFLGKNRQGVILKEKGKKIHQTPLKRLKVIVIKTRGIVISTDLIHDCAIQGIDIEYLFQGKPLAKIQPFMETDAVLWTEQIEALKDQRSIHLAKGFVKGKIKNQRNLILYFGKYHSKEDQTFASSLEKELSAIDRLLEELSSLCSMPLETLRGKLFSIEGRASSIYWNMVKLLLDEYITFEGRVRKGAEDLVNSLLNYGYGILYSRIWHVLSRAGLNPYIGYLHKAGDNRPVLVFDFIEEFRQQMVDRIVFSMLRKGTELSLKEGLLTEDTKTKLIQNVYKRIYAYENFKGKRITGEEIMHYQAEQIAQYLKGRTKQYRPYVRKW